MTKFLINVVPQKHESRYSYLHRLFEANYYPNVGTILKPILGSKVYESNMNYISDNQELEDLLVNIFKNHGVNGEDLVLNQFDNILGYDPSTNEASKFYYWHYYTKYCPQCLKEGDEYFHRLYWDLSFITACIYHKISLIDRCPNCSQRITMNRLLKKRCKCGLSFIDAKARRIERPFTITVQENLLSLILNEKRQISVDNKLKLNRQEFFEIFSNFMRAIDQLKKSDLGINEEGKFVFNRNIKKFQGIHDLDLITSISYLITTKPSNNLSVLLKAIDGIKNVSLKHERYVLLKQVFKHKKGKVYYDHYMNYLNTLTSEYVGYRKTLKPIKSEKRYLTMKEAGKYLGKSYYTIVEMVEKGELPHKKEFQKGKEIILLDRKELEKYKRICLDRISLRSAASLIGIYPYQLERLCNSGLVKTFDDQKNKRLMSKKQIEKLKKQLLKNANVIEKVSDKLISLQQFLYEISRFHKDENNLTRVVKMLIKEEMPKYLLKGTGNLKGLYLCQQTLKDVIEIIKNERIHLYGYNMREAALILKVKTSKIKNLIDGGVFKRVTIIKNDSGKLISKYVSRNDIIEYLCSNHQIGEEKAIELIEYRLIKKD
jgi:excisionase family DNA binding protein